MNRIIDSQTAVLRRAIQELGQNGKDVAASAVAKKLGLLTPAEKQKYLYKRIQSLTESGEIKRVRVGVYKYIGENRGKRNKQQVMWYVLRIRKTVTASDLVELAGVVQKYAEEFLYFLENKEVVKRLERGKFRLINDPVIMPRNEDKARAMRELRKKNAREALAKLDQAKAAIEGILKEDENE